MVAWAHQAFGAPAALEEGGAWDYALHGSEERTAPLDLQWDAAQGQLRAEPTAAAGEPRRTLALTFSCTPALVDEFRRALLG